MKGFTLIEIITSIFIIAILSIFIGPSFSEFQHNTKLKESAKEIALSLRRAQQLAITEQVFYSVRFTTSTNSYTITNDATLETIYTATPASDVAITDITDLVENTATFNPTGNVTSAGSLTLTNSLDNTTTVEIKASGYVDIID